MSNNELLETLRFARAYCAGKLIWFSPALYRCRIFLTAQVEVAAIDDDFNIYFNPAVVTKIVSESKDKNHAMAQLGFLWIHEISHVLRDHGKRCLDIAAGARLWNVATDIEINDSNWDGLTMPEQFPGLLPALFKFQAGKIAEYYYGELDKNGPLKQEVETLLARKSIGLWDEGSGVHGQQRPWEMEPEKQKTHPIEVASIKREVAQQMKIYKHLYGHLPGSWAVWVEKILESRTDWRKILHHRMSTAISTGIGLRVDYTFARPNRRQSVYAPIITPSFSGDRSGRVAVVVDTSGSMGSNELGQAVGEVCRVLDEFKLPVTVIPCDAKAYEPIVLKTPSDYFKIKQLKGGGGTDMVAGIRAALALHPVPDTILVLTDGFTPYPPEPYRIPVVFGIFKNNYSQIVQGPPSPPWPPSAVVEIVLQHEHY